ncbi:MAG TPA: hypothetical protein VK203_10825 [Nostocaceae cyanobacterium]|nr:hypothetical protein [Nostocaceae cyanobacterium]
MIISITKQKQIKELAGELSLLELAETSQDLLLIITEHPDYKKLSYQPELTIGDGITALVFLMWAINNETNGNITTKNKELPQEETGIILYS